MASSNLNWTPQEFLQAILMDRLIPLSLDSSKIQQRVKILQELLNSLSKVDLLSEESVSSPHSSEIISKIVLAFETLQKQKNLKEAEALYLKALELLMEGIKLDRGDEKKWPALQPSQKAVRLLMNYFSESKERFVFEKEFRSFHVANYLFLASEKLEQKLLFEAEQEIIYAQEEIRHVIALCLKMELAAIREEAETISQTSNQSEREATLELMNQFLSSEKKEYSELSKQLLSFLEKTSFLESFVKKVSGKKFDFKKIESVRSIENLIDEVQAQNENLEIILSPDAKIDWRLFLQKILSLPDPQSHCYFRMPDVDRFLNVSIRDSGGEVLVQFDERGRLVRGPSVQGERGSVLDVAIIGAGPGGIGAGVNLTSLGVFRYIILERTAPDSTVRDIWSREKEADTFYSGPPDPIEGLIGMQDTTRAVFLNRMNSFIDYFHLNIQTGIQVKAIRREKDFWVLETTSGEYCAKNVLMTAGRYGKPKLLKWEEENLTEVQRVRIVRGVEVDKIQNSTVLVIGGGNTAFDNVKSLIAHGTGKKKNRVFISYPRKPFNVPASMHAHNNDQLMQWESEGKVTILWSSNTEKVESCEEKSPDGKVKQRLKIIFREENVSPLIVDYIAPAVGWQIDKEIMEKVGVQFIDGKNPDINPQTGQAYGLNPQGNRIPLEGLFIAGDYAIQKSVPAALTSNYRAVMAIVQRLKNKI